MVYVDGIDVTISTLITIDFVPYCQESKQVALKKVTIH